MLYIYTRVSTKKQADKGHSLEAQKEFGIQKAKDIKMGYELFEESGKSASYETIENRPVLTELVELISSGKVSDIYFTEWDRLTRDPKSLIELKALFRLKKVKVYTAQGSFDVNNYDDDFLSDIIIGMAQRENKLRVARSKRGMLEAVKQGKFGGGIPPYGYKVDKDLKLIIDEEEANIYLRMVEMSLSGMGAQTIARELNKLGIFTKYRKAYKVKGINLKDRVTGKIRFKNKESFIWKQGTIQCILRNSIYKGKRKFKGNYYDCPAIIDEITWQKMQDNFEKNRIISKRNQKHFYLLKNLCYCGICHRRFFGKIKMKKRERVYVCMSKKPDPVKNDCGNKNVNIDKLNMLVYKEVISALTNGNQVRGELKKFFSNIKENINEIESENKLIENYRKEINDEKDRLLNIYLRKVIDDDTFTSKMNEFKERLTVYEKKYEQNLLKINSIQNEEGSYSWLNKLEEEKEELLNCKDENRQRRILLEVVKQVIINYDKDTKEQYIEIEINIPVFKDGFSEIFLINDKLREHHDYMMNLEEKSSDNMKLIQLKTDFKLIRKVI